MPPRSQLASLTEFTDVERSLLARLPEHRIEPTLDRIRDVTRLLADPQSTYRVVHLTGTNGKTSTSRMIDSLLRAHGLRTGLLTSPHLKTMTERICLDGVPISKDDFVQTFRRVDAVVAFIERGSAHPMSFFEIIVAMAFVALADAGVDVGVVEVGMGGAWDATNVADGEVAVITPISLDHTEILGKTVERIAEEKSGIIKPGATVVTAQQAPEVDAIIARRAHAVGARLLREGTDFGVLGREAIGLGQHVRIQGLDGVHEIELPLAGAHQARNAATAMLAAQCLMSRHGRSLSSETISAGFAGADSPGRLERVQATPPVYLDAAHNPAGIEALDAAARELAWAAVTVVLGVMGDKDVDAMLVGLDQPWVGRLICTRTRGLRALPADELWRRARAATRISTIDRAGSVHEAMRLAGDASVCLVTGSIATIGEARTVLADGVHV